MGHRKHTHSASPTAAPSLEGELHERRHHNFTIELFLDETGQVSDIFIDHDQSEKPEKIRGWEPDKLIDFIARHASLPETKSERHDLTNHRSQESTTPVLNPLRESIRTRKPVQPAKASAGLKGTLHLREISVVPVDSEQPMYLLPNNRPFSVRFTVDLTEVVASRPVPLVYEATVLAKQLGGAERTAGKSHNRIGASKNTMIAVPCTGLPQGMYRFSLLVKLGIAGMEHERAASVVAFLEGGEPIEVY